MKSWLNIPDGSDFSIYNIPFGIFIAKGKSPRIGTRIGDKVVDLYELALAGMFHMKGLKSEDFHKDTLNDFIALGKEITGFLRKRIQELFLESNSELQNKDALLKELLIDADKVHMLMPVKVGDYTDFYSSKHHAVNVGGLFRPENPLLPNWKHLPIAYHGRASSIVVSGTPIKRPQGQYKPLDSEKPVFGPTRALDFELEMAFVIGKDSVLGEPINVNYAHNHIFGFVLFNDWSARDIQSWEYQPLGPFLAKNFASSISPWIVTLEALEPFKVDGPQMEEEVLPYLQTTGKKNFDVELEVLIQQEGNGSSQKIITSNFKYMYWNICQQLAHHTVNGCNVKVGDMMASGTISGPDKQSQGCLLELTKGGKEPLKLINGTERKYLEDGDMIIMKGFALKEDMRVGFGEVCGKIESAKLKV